MYLAGTDVLKALHVLASTVTFVLSEAVAGVFHIEIAHQRVTGHLGDDGRCGNRQTLGVALDDGTLGNINIGQRNCV